jgi:membrane-bound lytic murein transglycosylase D
MKSARILISLLSLVLANYVIQASVPVRNDTIDGRITYESDFEYVPMASIEEVADRFSCMETSLPLTFNERVYAFVQYFAVKDREYTRMIIERQNLYFPMFEELLRKYDMPEDLKYLSIVESGLNPTAISRVGAVGLWQFMPYTGRSYGLHQDWYIDERMDPFQATEAACKYLKSLYSMFGDWELAMAAYNSGPGNVRKAIRRSGYKKNFWEIYRYLPRETRSYVPQFYAVYYLLNHIDEHNFLPSEGGYMVEYDTIQVRQFADLKVLAADLNICEEDLKKLNPGIKRLAVPDNTNGITVRLPQESVDDFRANRADYLANAGKNKAHFEKLARNSVGSTYGRDKIVYRVRSGDVLGTIAQRFNVRVSDLRRWNGISGSMIRAGQRLDIWVNPSAFKAVPVAHKNVTPTKSPRDIPSSKIHVVRPGDTLWDISRMYKDLSIEKIKALNNLKNNSIKPGQKLIIG